VSIKRKIKQRKRRRTLRTRKRVCKSELPRVSVFRSLKYIYAQLVDDIQGRTLASYSSLGREGVEGDKKVIAHAIGLKLAEKAKKIGITAAIFDRGAYLYHGRVKALAEGLRKGGMKI